jgi:hypothetical protein
VHGVGLIKGHAGQAAARGTQGLCFPPRPPSLAADTPQHPMQEQYRPTSQLISRQFCLQISLDNSTRCMC